nr:uncharacterized protein CFP56_07967 [Quercus suber]
MALSQQPPPQNNERRRVKVYELKNNDWYDRGTGFCSGQIIASPTVAREDPDARIVVQSEDDLGRTLLETRITKDDGYQKQQETLIVWTESNGVDMALSFQEAEGCSAIWEFVSDIQGRLAPLAPDDGNPDDSLDLAHPVGLPEPQLGRLDEIEAAIRTAAQTPAGRDALTKFIMNPEQLYIMKLTPLVSMAEDLESLADLHKLCTIMKHLILLNDTAIIEFVVTDQAVMGVVDDPDFPSHRANHRQYLSDASRFKEVVPIEHPEVRRKIHYTYRLLYLKDVVLARILDDPTFSVLNSLIFFHQVDIVNHLQTNGKFLEELFGIFGEGENDENRKKDAVLFIQNCCAVSKNIQAQARVQLFQNFIKCGLFSVITFALRHRDAAVRVAGTDILVALIDHDAHLVRKQVFAAVEAKAVPLTDILIELLLVEVDLGVKSQMADAIKILLDPTLSNGMEMMNRQANTEFAAKQRSPNGVNASAHGAPYTDTFIQAFYDDSAKRLFGPLMALEQRKSMHNLSVHETSLFTHLVEVLCFFVRQHQYKSKLFILGEKVHARVAQLLQCPQKYMKLTALKWFRTCIGLQDEFHNRQMVMDNLLDPILQIVEQTMPRDNLLNSACLELFEYIKREGVKQIITHLVENFRARLMAITYVNTFQGIVIKYDQMAGVYGPVNVDDGAYSAQDVTPGRMVNGGQRFAGLKGLDQDEEAYFNADDDIDEDEEDGGLPTKSRYAAMPNGASPVKPLVDYPDDDEDDDNDVGEDLLASPHVPSLEKSSSSVRTRTTSSDTDVDIDAMDVDGTRDIIEDVEDDGDRGRSRALRHASSPHMPGSPPGSASAKRRREEGEDDDDALSKMMGNKRRNSSASVVSQNENVQLDVPGGNNASLAAAPTHSQPLRRKGTFKAKNETVGGPVKFSIKPTQVARGEDRAPQSTQAVSEQAADEHDGAKNGEDPVSSTAVEVDGAGDG